MENISSYIDHTFLGRAGERDAVRVLCDEALKAKFASVCVNPAEVSLAKRLLLGSGVKVCTVIGFPLGQNTTAVKVFEAQDAIANGAEELDFVINIRLLKHNRDECRKELESLAAVCKGKAVSKLIIECCELTDEEKIASCKMAKEAGFDFVKTSTGFAAGGATTADVRLMRDSVGEEMGVKASGGIRDRESALSMIEAGASRIGSSRSCQIAGLL